MRRSILASIVIAAAMSMVVHAAPIETQTVNVNDKLLIDLPAEWEMEKQEPMANTVTDTMTYEGDGISVELHIFDNDAAAEALEVELSSLEDYTDVNFALIDGFFYSDFDDADYELIESHDCGGLTLTGTTGIATGKRDGEDYTGYIYVCYNSGLWYFIEFFANCEPDSDLGKNYSAFLDDLMTNAHPTIINGDVYDDADTVRKVQEELSNYGRPCTADGVMGPGTAEALKAYQADNMLSVNGVITDEVLESLEIQ